MFGANHVVLDLSVANPSIQSKHTLGFRSCSHRIYVDIPALGCDESARCSIASTYFVQAISHRDVIPVWIIDPLWHVAELIRKPLSYLHEIEAPQ
jgi:hypothetical protein